MSFACPLCDELFDSSALIEFHRAARHGGLVGASDSAASAAKAPGRPVAAGTPDTTDAPSVTSATELTAPLTGDLVGKQTEGKVLPSARAASAEPRPAGIGLLAAVALDAGAELRCPHAPDCTFSESNDSRFKAHLETAHSMSSAQSNAALARAAMQTSGTAAFLDRPAPAPAMANTSNEPVAASTVQKVEAGAEKRAAGAKRDSRTADASSFSASSFMEWNESGGPGLGIDFGDIPVPDLDDALEDELDLSDIQEEEDALPAHLVFGAGRGGETKRAAKHPIRGKTGSFNTNTYVDRHGITTTTNNNNHTTTTTSSSSFIRSIPGPAMSSGSSSGKKRRRTSGGKRLVAAAAAAATLSTGSNGSGRPVRERKLSRKISESLDQLKRNMQPAAGALSAAARTLAEAAASIPMIQPNPTHAAPLGTAALSTDANRPLATLAAQRPPKQTTKAKKKRKQAGQSAAANGAKKGSMKKKLRSGDSSTGPNLPPVLMGNAPMAPHLFNVAPTEAEKFAIQKGMMLTCTMDGKLVFPCNRCQKYYATATSLRHHMLASHVKCQVYCQVSECQKSFDSVAELRKHSINEHSNAVVHCCRHRGCTEFFDTAAQLDEHFQSAHGGAKPLFQCVHASNCGREFSSRSAFHRHEQWHKQSDQAAAAAQLHQLGGDSSGAAAVDQAVAQPLDQSDDESTDSDGFVDFAPSDPAAPSYLTGHPPIKKSTNIEDDEELRALLRARAEQHRRSNYQSSTYSNMTVEEEIQKRQENRMRERKESRKRKNTQEREKAAAAAAAAAAMRVVYANYQKQQMQLMDGQTSDVVPSALPEALEAGVVERKDHSSATLANGGGAWSAADLFTPAPMLNAQTVAMEAQAQLGHQVQANLGSMCAAYPHSIGGRIAPVSVSIGPPPGPFQATAPAATTEPTPAASETALSAFPPAKLNIRSAAKPSSLFEKLSRLAPTRYK